MPLENQNIAEVPTQKSPEVALTPEQIQEKILQEVLEKYGVDLKEYTYDQTKFWLQTLKIELETTPEELLVEKKSQELYKDFIDGQLQNGNVEKIVSLDSLSQSIDSDRIQALKEELEPILDKWLEKYSFLDTQNKNFIKLWFINSLLKSPVAEIGESLIGWVGKFIWKLSSIDPNNIQSISNALKENPEDSWRTLALEEEFTKKWSSYTNKFDEIQERFANENIADTKQQQNILSHVDWLRNPSLIEAGAQWLDVKNIDFSKKEKNTAPFDTKSLSEYLQGSREKITELSKKLNMWDKTWDVLYSILNDGGSIGNGVQKIVETLLKIPFLWKFLAIFLGLSTDPKKAIEELNENKSNFKILSTFKSLWVSKDQEGKTVEWKEPFKDIDLSEINFNSSKKEIQKVKDVFWDVSEKDLPQKWQEAFSSGIKKDDFTIKFDISTAWDDKKITTKEFKDMVNTGLSGYEKQKTQANQQQRETQQKQVQEQLNSINIEKNTVSLLSWKAVEWFSETNWLWDFKKIPLSQIQENQNIENILKTNLWENVYQNLSWELKESLKKSFVMIQDFLKTPESSLFIKADSNIWDVIKVYPFQEFIGQKNTTLASQEKQLTEEEKKYTLAEKIKESFTKNSETIKLSSWVNIDDTKIMFTNNQLTIWNDNFVISWVDATITDIVISTNDVQIEWKKWIFSGSEKVSKDLFAHGIQELVLNWSFQFKNEKWEKISIAKA